MPINTVLVVEDEKPIRQGICAMVRRAPVGVKRVLECRNGQEAMHCLDEDQVDLVITDLRMPKMDGLELVHRMNRMPRHPLVVVVSGYDDFESVSGMLRMGVRDYVLKPVEREQMYELLARMERELEAEQTRLHLQSTASRQVVRAALRGERTGPETLRSAAGQLAGPELWSDFSAICMQPSDGSPYDALSLGEVHGQQVMLAGSRDASMLLQGEGIELCAGLSGAHEGCDLLCDAHREARRAREHAYIQGRSMHIGACPPAQERREDGRTVERVVQLLGVGDADAARQALGELLFLTQNGSAGPDVFIDCIASLSRRLSESYPVFPEVSGQLAAFLTPLAWRSAYACYSDLVRWMEEFCERGAKAEENRNQHKIQAAVEFLRQHFAAEIDMAVVSNHVSMNYSQFSSLFKRYTGQGFQDYLRMLRIEEGKRLLRDTGLSIRQVSERSGFKNEKHFMKAFKQAVAVSPSEYRGNLRGQPRSDGMPEQAPDSPSVDEKKIPSVERIPPPRSYT